MWRTSTGVFFVLHGLAHATVGMWAADRGPAAIVTPLWLVAMLGFIAAGFGLLGMPGLRRRWEALTVGAVTASLLLLLFFGHLAFAAGLIVDAVVLVLGLQWAEACDCEPIAPPAHPVRRRSWTALGWAFLLYVGAVVALRPWYITWGTTPDERMMTLPGDGLVPNAHYRMDHAITIRASADSVWPWLAQIGQDRGGFYSYDGLERLMGADIHNADRLVPAWQQRDTGELVRAVPPDWMGGRFGRDIGWRVAYLEPGRAIVLQNWGAFVVRPIDAHNSRLQIRLRGDGTPSVRGALFGPLGLLVFEPAHFIMERGMMRGIKERAEGRA